MLSLEQEIAWAAGLFEGEGCIFETTVKSHGRQYHYVRLTLKTTDEDVLDHFHEVVKHGKVYATSQKCKGANFHYKDSWFWQLGNEAQVKSIVALFWPFLGARRRARAIELGVAPD